MMLREINPTFALRRTSTAIAVAILTLTLVAALSGAMLAFYYEPTAGGSYHSLEYLNNEVNFGWLVRGLHDYAGNFVIALGLVQMVVMFLGRQFRASWLTGWISGIFLILAAIGLGWTAMSLDWSQTGFWRFSIELGTVEAIPAIGPLLREVLTGGGGISTATILRQYALHSYVLSVAAIAAAVVHLVGLLFQDRRERRIQLEKREEKVEQMLNRIVQKQESAEMDEMESARQE